MTEPDGVVRILIVDDSAVMRSLLRAVLMTDARLEVLTTASDGESGLRAMETMRPDLVLLDVEMPVMDGLSTLRAMRDRGLRVPVIMCSTLTQRGAQVTMEALATGAADYVAKPSGQPSREAAVDALAHDLIPKILALTTRSTMVMNPLRTTAGVLPPLTPSVPGAAIFEANRGTAPSGSAGHAGTSAAPRAVVMGVSTGGPAALDMLLPALPGNFPLPVLVVQHMPELFTKLLAERLDSRCALRVVEAQEEMAVESGHVYVAKGDWHMELAAGGRRLRLTQALPENHCRPSVDVLFRSAAAVWGNGVLGVILTGMGADGLAGCRMIQARGGSVLAQDQETSAVWGMPGAVAQAGLAMKVLPLQAIAGELMQMAHRKSGAGSGVETMRQKWAV